jgi:hypothetical protein
MSVHFRFQNPIEYFWMKRLMQFTSNAISSSVVHGPAPLSSDDDDAKCRLALLIRVEEKFDLIIIFRLL